MPPEPARLAARLRPAAWALAAVPIALVAAVLRMVNLDHYPGGLLPSEARLGSWALAITGANPTSPPLLSGGHGPLAALLSALLLQLGAPPVTALRLLPALAASATALLLPLCLRHLGRIASLVAGVWFALSMALLVNGRLSSASALDPLLVILVVATLSAATHRGRGTSIVAGLALGLGLWQGPELLMTVAAALVWWRLVPHRDGTPRHAGWLALGIGLLAVPLLLAVVADPHGYWGSGPDLGALPGNALGLMASLFGVQGSTSVSSNLSSLPLLGLPLALLLVVGVVAAWRRRGEPLVSLLLAAAVAGLVPPLVSGGGAGDVQSLLPLTVPLAALLGLGMASTVERVPRANDPTLIAVAGLCTAVLVVTASGAVSALNRPEASLYLAEDGVATQLAEASDCGPACLVVATFEQASVISYLDVNALPTVLPPGVSMSRPSLFSRIVAVTDSAIAQAAGASSASDVHAVGLDPSGDPMVMIATP